MKERFLAYIESEKRYSTHTVLAYRTDLEQFSEFLKTSNTGEDIASSDHTLIRSWIIALSEAGLNSRSINRKISTLRAFFRYLHKENLITSDPTGKILSPKTSKKLPVYIEPSGIDILFNMVRFPDDFSGRRDKMILELFYATGIRLSELTELKTEDIDLGNNTLRVTGKRNKQRIIPFSSGISRLLSGYLKERDILSPGYNRVFITKNGKPAYRKMIYNIVNKYLGLATTLNKRSPHVLRHTFATHLLNNGAELNAVKELLGHASLSATQVYTHNTIEKLKNVYHQAHPRA